MNSLERFDAHRGLLFSIAYHMLGTVMDAEDMVQETFLRWQALTAAEREAVQTPKAYLTTIITRLCLDQLKSARQQRETYIGEWLPEPLVMDAHMPEQLAVLGETLSVAMLVILEKLSPAERAVFLLRKVFDYDYAEIATITGKSEANCRQIMSRAQKQLIADRPIVEATPLAQQQTVLQEFMAACVAGDIDQAMLWLHADAVSLSDGGGLAKTALKPIFGAEKIARFYIGLNKRAPQNTNIRFITVNGQVGILVEVEQKPYTLMTFDVVGGRIRQCFNLVNPEKLAHTLKGLSS